MNTKHLKEKRIQLYLDWMALFLYRRFRVLLVIFLLVTLVLGVFGSRLQQKTTIRDLLPEGNEVVRRFEETVRDFDLIDRVVIAVRFKPENLEQAQAFAEILVEQTKADPAYDSYLYWFVASLGNLSSSDNWYRYLEYLPRVLPEKLLVELIARLEPENIRRQIEQNMRDLESGIASKALIERDPLQLVSFAGNFRESVGGNYQIDFTDGFLIAKDRDLLLILGKPKLSAEDVDFAAKMDRFLQANIAKAKAQFELEEGQAADELLQIGLTGPHPIAAHENRLIKRDVVMMFVSSFLTVLALFVIAYRRPMAMIYVGIPLLCAEIWTMGIGYLLFGRLNLLTASSAAIIVGLGVDYAIHLFSRYLDERDKWDGPLPAMRMALRETGMGNIVGAWTTALAFLAMALSSFPGLVEFAVLSFVGIMTCVFLMLTLLPCMLFWRETWTWARPQPTRVQWDFHIEWILKTASKAPRLVLISALLITLIMAVYASKLRVSNDVRSVRARSNPSIVLQSLVTQKVGGSLKGLTFVLESPNEAGLYRLHGQLEHVLGDLHAQGRLARYDSLLSYLCPPSQQEKNLALLRESRIDGQQVQRLTREAMTAYGFRLTDSVQNYLEQLALGLDAREPLTLSALLERNSNLLRPFLNHSNGLFKTVVHVYPAKGLWEKNETTQITDQILASVQTQPGEVLFVTGTQTIAETLKELVRESFGLTSLVAAALVLFILIWHFQRFSLVALAMAPLLIGVIWMLGTMKLLGIDITVLNFVATPLVIGIGIDDGVHIIEKYLARDEDDLTKLMASCGKAVTLTSLTTILGFGSLFLAQYSGFHSLGLCAILGVSYCWLASVLILPLFLKQLAFKTRRLSL